MADTDLRIRKIQTLLGRLRNASEAERLKHGGGDMIQSIIEEVDAELASLQESAGDVLPPSWGTIRWPCARRICSIVVICTLPIPHGSTSTWMPASDHGSGSCSICQHVHGDMSWIMQVAWVNLPSWAFGPVACQAYRNACFLPCRCSTPAMMLGSDFQNHPDQWHDAFAACCAMHAEDRSGMGKDFTGVV